MQTTHTHSQTKPEPFALQVLKAEYLERVRKNPQYSLRSFAKNLGVSHSLLSLVLNGQRKISRSFMQKICEKLNLTTSKQKMLLQELNGIGAEVASQSEMHKLSLEQFALISEWQHYAILSLLEIPDTKFDPVFIGQRLGINPMLAKVSMQRLYRLGYIEKTNGKWKQKTNPIIVENINSTLSSKKFQRQLLKKAAESLELDPVEVRELSSMTFAFDPKHLPYAHKRIKDFRRQLCKELEEFGKPQEVYNLTVQLCPVSRRRKK